MKQINKFRLQKAGIRKYADGGFSFSNNKWGTGEQSTGVGTAAGLSTFAGGMWDNNSSATNQSAKIGSSMLEGAGTGAGIGMTFGPIGAAIGAGVGAIGGGIMGEMKYKDAQKKLLALNNQRVQQMENSSSATMRGMPNTNLAQNDLRVNSNQNFANGGISKFQQGNPTAELEKGEPFRTPDGKMYNLGQNMPSHAQGGVKLNLPSGTEILGNNMIGSKEYKQVGTKLKSAQSAADKTLAEPSTALARATAKRNLQNVQSEWDNLIQQQEAEKTAGMENQQFAQGGYSGIGYTQHPLNPMFRFNQQYATGGEIDSTMLKKSSIMNPMHQEMNGYRTFKEGGMIDKPGAAYNYNGLQFVPLNESDYHEYYPKDGGKPEYPDGGIYNPIYPTVGALGYMHMDKPDTTQQYLKNSAKKNTINAITNTLNKSKNFKNVQPTQEQLERDQQQDAYDQRMHQGMYAEGDINDKLPMEAKGGTIHIKPENKGKFNATKAKTGKSTEELTHSSNPVTKKRAIFSQNAAKWKHEDGGQVNAYDYTRTYANGGQVYPVQPWNQMAPSYTVAENGAIIPTYPEGGWQDYLRNRNTQPDEVESWVNSGATGPNGEKINNSDAWNVIHGYDTGSQTYPANNKWASGPAFAQYAQNKLDPSYSNSNNNTTTNNDWANEYIQGPSTSELREIRPDFRGGLKPLQSIGMSNPDTQVDIGPNPNMNKLASPYKDPTIKPPPGPNYGNIAAGIGEALPSLYNLGRGLFEKPAHLNASNYYNPFDQQALDVLRNRKYNYDINPQLAQANVSARIADYNAKNMGSSQSEMMNRQQANAGLRNQQYASAYSQKSNIENQMNNQYSGEYANALMGAGQARAGVNYQTDMFNLQSQAAKRNLIGTALSQGQQGVESYLQQRNMQNRDKMMLGMLPYALQNYGIQIDPNTGQLIMPVKH